MSRVAVLLSTYNGEAYIKEQIESIYRQSYKNFRLYIRDDGSNEAFRKQLEHLQKKFGFVLFEGENLGFVGSFMWLLRRVNDVDYYAFADQDDIWKEDKIKKAVDWFDKYIEQNNARKKRPALFHSAYNIIDNNGIIKDYFYFPDGCYDFRRSITENHYSGFSMVINKPLRNLMIRGKDDKIGYHDWWASMIVHAFGTAHSDNEVMSIHRLHGNNVTRFNMSTRFRWLVSSLKEDSDIDKRAVEFYRCFGYKLNDRDIKILKLFCKDRYSIIYALKKCFYPARWRPIISSEIVVRLLMLIGRI